MSLITADTANTVVWRSPQGGRGTLREDLRADVVVVGAGVVGVTTAVQLAASGADVVLLAAGRVGEGVTGRSTAKATALHQVVYADLISRHGSRAAQTYATAVTDAMTWIRGAAEPVWQTRSAVTVARGGARGGARDPGRGGAGGQDEVATLRREAAAAREAGLDVHLDEQPDHFPGAALGMRLDDQGQIDPVGFLQHLLETAGHGIRTHDDTTVTGLSERPGGARVTTAHGSVQADTVVVATGLPIFDRGGFFALCEPAASYVVALEHPAGDGTGVAAGNPEEHMMITAGSPSISLRWATDAASGRRVVLVGGEGHRTGTGGSTIARYERLTAWAQEHLVGTGAVVARWSAEDFMSPDRLPYAGPHLRLGGPVHVVTGLSKWGITLGVACATALAQRIGDGTISDFGKLVDPARLPGLKGTQAVVKANAEVAQHMASGWAHAMAGTVGADPAEGEGTVGRTGLTPRARCRVDGEVHEVSAVCRHLGGIVAWNDGDRTWDCPLHGSRFDHDGAVRHGPTVKGL